MRFEDVLEPAGAFRRSQRMDESAACWTEGGSQRAGPRDGSIENSMLDKINIKILLLIARFIHFLTLNEEKR